MLARDARQNELVERRCPQLVAQNHRHVAVRAFRHAVAHIFAVVHRLKHAFALGRLRAHHGGQQVQRFNVAVIETRIGLAAQLDALRSVRHGLRRDSHPQIAGAFHVIMFAGRGAARALVIDEMLRSVDLFHQVAQQIGKLFARHGNLDARKARAIVEAIEVVVERENLIVARGTRIIHAVAKPAHTIVHGNGHFLDGAECAVVVAEIFHNRALPSKQMP